MNYDRFESECIGVKVTDWPHPLVGIFNGIDEEWGKISPIPEKLPLSKQWQGVDSDIYFKFCNITLIRHIKYVEYKNNEKDDKNEKLSNPSKSASG